MVVAVLSSQRVNSIVETCDQIEIAIANLSEIVMAGTR